MNNPILIKENILKDIIFIIFSLIMTSFCLLFFLVDLKSNIPSFLIKILSLMGVILFGIIVFYFIHRIITKKYLLIVDECGITDYTSAISLGFIPWQDIEIISKKYIMGIEYISFSLYDNKKYINKLNSINRLLITLNQKMGFKIGLINCKHLNIDTQYLYCTMLFFSSTKSK